MKQEFKKIDECEICGFSDMPETLAETENGICHQECLDDLEKEYNPDFSFQKQLEEFDTSSDMSGATEGER